MIHIFLGTKAQFIKMAPVILELDRRRIAYNLIDAGQHAGLTAELANGFGLRAPDVVLRAEKTNISKVSEAAIWVGKNLGRLVFKPTEVCRRLFHGRRGICLIHGDTLTTLLSLFYARRCGIKVAHIEAGLRSYDLFNPFPEEIVRRIAMRYSHLLFAASDLASDNLRKMGYGAKTIQIGENTIAEAVRFALQRISGSGRPPGRYAVASIHRVENIYSRSRMETIVQLLERVAEQRQVVFVVHDATRRQLEKLGLGRRLLQIQSVQMLPLQRYFSFIDLLAGAEFIVTDGGSVQEESYYLNVPCLIMRTRTERAEGLGENALLAKFEKARIDLFLEAFPSLRRAESQKDLQPSRVIVDHLLSWANAS